MEWIKERMKVEKQSKDKTWFEGIVKTINSNHGSVFCEIQFDKLQSADGKPWVETVPLNNVRPVPPHRELPLPFSEGLYIEVYDTDCWIRGFLVGKLTGGEELWLVSFTDTRRSKSYPISAFRLAQDWEGGKWTLVSRVRQSSVRRVTVGSSKEEISGLQHRQSSVRTSVSFDSSEEEDDLQSQDDHETTLGCFTKQIIPGVDQTKEHPLSSDSEMIDNTDLYRNLLMNENLDLYRCLLRAFHKNKCSLSEEQVKMLINDIRLELNITESEDTMAMKEIS